MSKDHVTVMVKFNHPSELSQLVAKIKDEANRSKLVIHGPLELVTSDRDYNTVLYAKMKVINYSDVPKDKLYYEDKVGLPFFLVFDKYDESEFHPYTTYKIPQSVSSLLKES